MKQRALLMFAVAAACSHNLVARADVDTTLYAGIEQYDWQEYSPVTGATAMKESGPRLRVGLNVAGQPGDGSFILDGDFSMYQGAVDYSSSMSSVDPVSGATVTTPISSKDTYAGGDLHFDAVYSGFGQMIQPVVTLGYEGWRRSVDSSYVTVNYSDAPPASGTVVGYTEAWSMFYSKLGLRGKVQQFSWNLGLKLPFLVTDQSDYMGVSVHPQGDLGGYVGVDYAFARKWQVSLNYEATRFGQSGVAYSSFGPVLQPKSDEDLYTLSVHRAF